MRVAPLPPASPRFTSPDLIAHASDSFKSLGTSRNSFQSLSCLRCHPEASPPLVQTAEPNSCRWGRQEIDSSSAVEPSCGCSTLTSWGSHARCAGEGMLAAGQLCEGSHEPGARSAGSGRAPAWLHLQEGMCCICLDDFAQGDLARCGGARRASSSPPAWFGVWHHTLFSNQATLLSQQRTGGVPPVIRCMFDKASRVALHVVLCHAVLFWAPVSSLSVSKPDPRRTLGALLHSSGCMHEIRPSLLNRRT